MREEPAQFYSDGFKLDASYWWPEGEDTDKPLCLINSGYTGLKKIHPERFARFLTKKGYPCFGFDYRGFENSEGDRQRILLEDQISDIAHAISFLSARGRPLVVLGWAMSSGMILEATRVTAKPKGLVMLNGFYNAQRVQKAVRGEEGWNEFWSWLQAERGKAAGSGEFPLVDPFRIYPLDPVSKTYVDSVLRATSGYNAGADRVRLSFADSLLSFAPEHRLDHLADVPILIAHGDQNALHPTVEAETLHRLYPGPKELHWIKGGGHTEWMTDDNPIFLRLVDKLYEWLGRLA